METVNRGNKLNVSIFKLYFFFLSSYLDFSYYTVKSEMEMRRIFQQKYVLRVIAFLVFALAVANVSMPKIEEYNWKIYEEQEKLQIEANGVDNRKVSFELSHEPPLSDAFTFILAILFLSLILTKRIILSFLSVFLFGVQIASAVFLVSYLQKADYYFSYPGSLYFEWLLSACQLALSFCLAFSICRFCSRKLHAETVLK